MISLKIKLKNKFIKKLRSMPWQGFLYRGSCLENFLRFEFFLGILVKNRVGPEKRKGKNLNRRIKKTCERGANKVIRNGEVRKMKERRPRFPIEREGKTGKN